MPPVDESGAAKLHLVSRVLRLRRAHPEWFGAGAGYTPLGVEGPAAHHCVAFRRGERVVTVATRLPAGLQWAGWDDTALALPDGEWVDELGGRAWNGRVALADLLVDFPGALLVRRPEDERG